MTRVAVFGLGYVGCVTAACLSRDGHSVIGVDVDRDKVAEVNAGVSPVSESGLDDLLRAEVQAGRLRATIDPEAAVAESDIALVAVGTPSAADGSVTYNVVEHVVQSIGEALLGSSRPYHVVIRSTLLPGILEERLRPRLESSSGRKIGENLLLSNNPEFLRESSAIKDYYNPPFVLVGVDAASAAAQVRELYHSVETEYIVTDTRTAALVKYACNAFHATKIAFANEIGSLSQSMGADGHKVMDIVCKDHKLNISKAYLRPGFAFGGSCLPKDLRALTRFAEHEALRLNLLASVLPSNESHLKRALTVIRGIGHRKVGVVGLSFKAGTDDLRESPMVEIVETMIGWGLQVKIYDPNVMLGRLRGRNLAYIDRHLPHLAELLVPHPTMLLSHAQTLLLCTDVANEFDWRSQHTGQCVDLRSDLAKALQGD
jgi:GDP-mannose 6-dehydrogenase